MQEKSQRIVVVLSAISALEPVRYSNMRTYNQLVSAVWKVEVRWDGLRCSIAIESNLTLHCALDMMELGEETVGCGPVGMYCVHPRSNRSTSVTMEKP